MNNLSAIQEGMTEYWGTYAPDPSDEIDEMYDAAVLGNWQQELCGRIRRHFPDKKPEDVRVLEIATGPGTFSILMAKEGFKVTAVDLAPEMIGQAKKNAARASCEVDYRVMNSEELSFDEGTFDAVFCRWGTWVLPRPEKAYSEWVRVLKKDGIL